MGTWCNGITPAQHAGGPGFNPQCVHLSFPWLATARHASIGPRKCITPCFACAGSRSVSTSSDVRWGMRSLRCTRVGLATPICFTCSRSVRRCLLDHHVLFVCWCRTRGSHGYIAQWLERLTADQQFPGSNPGVPSFQQEQVELGIFSL